MNTEAPPAGEDELPAIDEVLARALTAQGDRGVRALGLLRDARRILAGTTLERPGEVAESCLRGAADALLSLPGAPVRRAGLRAAAAGLLDALGAVPGRPSAAVRPARPSAGADAEAAWDRVEAAAGVLRGELARPGGRHTGRAASIAERLMGVRLGAAQEEALEVWGEVYGKTSNTLHGKAADAGRPARLYAEVLAAARELLVPLPGRAARVLELTALQDPGPGHVRELARWADPRATAYFLRSRPAPAWLPLLQEHAPHLLLPDPAAGGTWPAGVFLEHLAATAPQMAGAWLAGHAPAVAAGGRAALDALLSLAAGDAALLAPAMVRAVLDEHAAGAPAGEGDVLVRSRVLRRAAEWACAVPVAGRDRDWILVAERLLQGALDTEHEAADRMRAAETGARAAAALPALGPRRPFSGDPADWVAAVRADSARMPQDLAERLLDELVATAHPGGPAAAPHRSVRMIRAVAVSLLVRDVELTAPAARRTVFHEDLHPGASAEPAPGADGFGGPLLARAVLDLAAADAAAGVGLDERTAQWHKAAAADGWLADRIWAAHLAVGVPGRCLSGDPHEGAAGSHDDLHEAPAGSHEAPPAAPRPQPDPELEVVRWHELAYGLVPRLLAGTPYPELARLVAAVWRSCPPRATAALEAAAAPLLGRPPTAGDVAAALPGGAPPADSTALEPLASWQRVRDWSPVLPARLLAGFGPLLDGLRRLAPDGPPDPRVGARPVPASADVDGAELLELAAVQGPQAAARALAATGDAAEDHAFLVGRLVAADPAAWTADVPAVLAALNIPVLRALYLDAVQESADRPGALPGPSLDHAVAAALDLHAPAPAPAPAPGPGPGCGCGPGPEPAGTLERLAETALFGLLAHAWTRPAGPAGLGPLLPAALERLRVLAEPLIRPAAGPPPDPADVAGARPAAGRLPELATAVRALESLLDCTLSAAIRPGAPLPDDVLDLCGTILAAGSNDPAVAAAFGARLMHLNICAPGFTEAHRTELTTLDDGPTPAAAWLQTGRPDPQLLAQLDRTAVLKALRPDAGGPAEHLAHALTENPHLLGDPADVLAQIAAGPGGPAAVSWLLQVTAWRLQPHRGNLHSRTFRFTRTPARPATTAELAAVTTVWRAALTAGLPAGALAGAGYFADLALDDRTWLPLARAAADHTPPHDPATAARRASAHPADPDALQLTTRLVARPAGLWNTRDVLRPARALLQAAEAVPGHPHAGAVAQLREALVNAGEVDVARPDAS
ncbi:hypothetical protein ACFVQ9_35475 [Streptomyces goshikiensis]|uniref:hypothetical protein n=1 Tax=Streptomyces goshikiensis TaxID=1942 RepID=UPI003694BABB